MLEIWHQQSEVICLSIINAGAGATQSVHAASLERSY